MTAISLIHGACIFSPFLLNTLMTYVAPEEGLHWQAHTDTKTLTDVVL